MRISDPVLFSAKAIDVHYPVLANRWSRTVGVILCLLLRLLVIGDQLTVKRGVKVVQTRLGP
jgi:hypothetical protein